MNPDEVKDFFLRVGQKIDNINENVTDLKVTAAQHELTLQEHIRRTEMAEARLDKFESEIKPVLQGIGFLKSVAKFAAWAATILKAISIFFR